MATVTTTYFFLSDQASTDRSVAPSWTKPQASSSQAQSWKFVSAKAS
jgi:hypothetical protein